MEQPVVGQIEGKRVAENLMLSERIEQPTDQIVNRHEHPKLVVSDLSSHLEGDRIPVLNIRRLVGAVFFWDRRIPVPRWDIGLVISRLRDVRSMGREHVDEQGPRSGKIFERGENG
jgi:hypothetical protein